LISSARLTIARSEAVLIGLNTSRRRTSDLLFG
jgi:hypothetical protein